MSANLTQSNASNPLLEKLKNRLRLSIIGLSLILVLYNIVYLLFLIPTDLIQYYWRPDHVMTVRGVNEAFPTGIKTPRKGDIIVKINDKPVIRGVFRSRYPLSNETRLYTIKRNNNEYTITMPNGIQDLNQIRDRLTVSVVALLAWLLGAAIVFAAPSQNRDAWHLGLSVLAIAIVVITSEGAIQGVPGGWITSNPFLPLIAVAWAQVALLPRHGTRPKIVRNIFSVLYSLAALLGLIAAFELIFLDPSNTSIQMIIGFSLYEVLLLWTAVGLLAHLIIIGLRAVFMSPSYQRRQVRIILFFVALAYLPSVLLTMLPRILFDIVFIPWEISIALMLLAPAGYGFVILRSRFLGLDLFMTRALSWLLVSLSVVSSYSLLRYISQPIQQPIIDVVILFLLLLAIPQVSTIIRRGIDAIIFDSAALYRNRVAHYTTQLANDPQVDTLGVVVDDLAALLQIRQVALMLTTDDDLLVSVHQSRIQQPIQPIPTSTLPTKPMIMQSHIKHSGDDALPISCHYPWVHYSVPLVTQDVPVGLLLLGPPLPDSILNAEQQTFLLQTADILAVTISIAQLLQSSRQMSQALIQVRDEERMMLATKLHDDPLHRISLLSSQVIHLAGSTQIADEFGHTLTQVGQELQQVNQQLRGICAGLYPPVIQMGPQWAVIEIVETYENHKELTVTHTVDVCDELVISEKVSKALYYLLSEALNNIDQHANASKVHVNLTYADNVLRLTIDDDGTNQSPAVDSLASLLRAHHFGLIGMHELAHSVGGTFKVTDCDGGGSTTTFTIPITNEAANPVNLV